MRCGTQARCRSATRSQHTQSSRLAPCCSPRSSPHHHAPQQSRSCRRCSPRCSRQQSSRSQRRSSQLRSSRPAVRQQTQSRQCLPAVRQPLCTQHHCCSPTRWPGKRCVRHGHQRSTPPSPSRPAPQQSRWPPRCSPRCSRQQSSRSQRRSSQLRSSHPAATRQTLQSSGPRRRIQQQRGKQARCRCATRSRPTRCPRLDQQR